MKYAKFFLLGILLCIMAISLVFIYQKTDTKIVYQAEDTGKPELNPVPINTTVAVPTLESFPAVDASKPDWTFERYQTLMTASGRKPGINENTFLQIQERKKTAGQIVDGYLTERLGSTDGEVLRAFNEVPREYFQYHYQNNNSFADVAYEDQIEKVKPWAIGWGSALSDYLGQVYMTQVIKPTADDTVLEVGTGSGYQSALLSRIVKKVYSIEIIEPLGQAVSKIYQPLGYDNIETRVGDGFFGWPEVKDGFDVIIVTAAAQYVPPALIEQLKPNGRMIIPVGQPFKRGQVLYIYTKDDKGLVHSRKDMGVYFIPMTGAIQKNVESEAL